MRTIRGKATRNFQVFSIGLGAFKCRVCVVGDRKKTTGDSEVKEV